MKYDLSFEKPKVFTDKNLQKILQFYLFECPVEGISYRGKDFKEFGYRGNTSFSILKKKLLNNATPSLRDNYYPCKKEDLPQKFSNCHTIEYPDEFCVFLKHDERTVIRSLFSAIRNALAHGSFNVKAYNGTRIYFFLNYKDYEKARIILHETTLLSWIKVIKGENT